MNKLLITLCAAGLLLSSSVFAGQDTMSFKDWIAPITAGITPQDISSFKSKLTLEQAAVFEQSGPATQALCVRLYQGLQAQKINVDPYMAVKMAYKMESGYFFHKASIRTKY